MTEIILVLIGSVLGAFATKLTELSLQAYASRRRSRAKFALVNHEEVMGWGWDGTKLLKQLIALDRKVIGDALTDEREGTVDQWGPVFTEHPETWTLLSLGPKHVVGYWHFAALRDAQFLRAKAGYLLDSEITLDIVEPIDVPGIYNLYFTLLGVLPDHRGAGALLIDAFFTRLESLAERGVLFREICANAFTKDGRRICEGFGMHFLCPHSDFGSVYTLPLYPWPDRLRHKRWGNLAKLYEPLGHANQPKLLVPSDH
ncbi:MAG: hypothetical protein HY809_06765 [Nitrospirae bacterium]|nr:hypothetical protein [Nitrospirota bacterium]